MMNMSRFLCVGVSAAALLYCGDVWASEIYGTSVPEGYQAYNLNESGLNAGMMLSLPQKGAKQVASVCFITDAGNCGGAGGGIDSSSSSSGPGPIDPDGSNMCKLEGYVNTVCTNGQQKGDLCPYDSRWHTGCKCADEYNKTCKGADEQGKGATCNGKYKECCKKCTGYNYTSSNIPTGHIKTASCSSCTGTKYKTKCDTNSSNTGTYVNCGSATGSGSSCKDDTGTYYTKCTCPTMYEWSASAKKCVCSTGYKYTCSGTGYAGGEGNSCDNKYQKCKCASGYTWNASTGTCTCGSTYKYTCSGSNITGGSGTACGGKYTACKCATGFTWNSSSGMCVCNGTDWCSLNQDCTSLGYKQQSCSEWSIKCPFNINYVYCMGCPTKYTPCSGIGMVGSGARCGELYEVCKCKEGYIMVDGVCEKNCDGTYKYTCTGMGYYGGVGEHCDGKYQSCQCQNDYKWQNGKCEWAPTTSSSSSSSSSSGGSSSGSSSSSSGNTSGGCPSNRPLVGPNDGQCYACTSYVEKSYSGCAMASDGKCYAATVYITDKNVRYDGTVTYTNSRTRSHVLVGNSCNCSSESYSNGLTNSNC